MSENEKNANKKFPWWLLVLMAPILLVCVFGMVFPEHKEITSAALVVVVLGYMFGAIAFFSLFDSIRKDSYGIKVKPGGKVLTAPIMKTGWVFKGFSRIVNFDLKPRAHLIKVLELHDDESGVEMALLVTYCVEPNRAHEYTEPNDHWWRERSSKAVQEILMSFAGDMREMLLRDNIPTIAAWVNDVLEPKVKRPLRDAGFIVEDICLGHLASRLHVKQAEATAA